MSYTVLDTNRDLSPARLAAWKGLGYKTVIGYLTTSTASEKIVTPQEAKNVAAAGLRLGLVYEVYGGVDDFAHADINAGQGVRHAAFVNKYAPTVGAPPGSVIYFAIDTDASQAEINSFVIPYFKSLKATLDPKYRLGVYGSGLVCRSVEPYVQSLWLSQSMGWHESRAYAAAKKYNLLQGPVTLIAGVDCDVNTVNPDKPDIGDFVPFSTGTGPVTPPAPAPNPYPVGSVSWLQETLNRRGSSLTVDGDLGPLTIKEARAACPGIKFDDWTVGEKAVSALLK